MFNVLKEQVVDF